MTENVTKDAFLDGKIQVLQPAKGGHRAGIDAVLLATAFPAQNRTRIADLGAGCGVAGFIAAARCPGAEVHLVELDPDMASFAREGKFLIENKEFSDGICVHQLDVAASSAQRNEVGLTSQTFDTVISTPPFNDLDLNPSPSTQRRLAHALDQSQLAEWVKTSADLLKSKGELWMIIRPSGLPELLIALDKAFGSVRVLPVFTAAGKNASRIIVTAKKGGRGAFSLLPGFNVHGDNERYSQNAEDIFRGRAALADFFC